MIIYKSFCRKSVELQGFFCWLCPSLWNWGNSYSIWKSLEWDKEDYVLYCIAYYFSFSASLLLSNYFKVMGRERKTFYRNNFLFFVPHSCNFISIFSFGSA